MVRSDTLTVRVNSEERKLLDQLAAREERTPSDVMRRLLRQAAQPAPGRQREQQLGTPKATT